MHVLSKSIKELQNYTFNILNEILRLRVKAFLCKVIGLT